MLKARKRRLLDQGKFPGNRNEHGATPITSMNLRTKISTSAALIFFSLGLACPVTPSAAAAASEGTVPAPSRAFTPRTAIAFYADVKGASKSAIWNALTNKAAPLMGQLQSLHRAQMASLPQALSGLQGTDIAEI